MVEIDGLEPSSLSTAVSLIPAPLPILAHIPIGYRLTTDSRTFLPAGLYCQESVMPGSDATTLPVVPSVELEPTASCSQSRRTTTCAMTTYQTFSGLPALRRQIHFGNGAAGELTHLQLRGLGISIRTPFRERQH